MLCLSACTRNFEEINTNPNAPEQVNPQFLLSNILYNSANNSAVDAWNAGNFLAQLTARFDFNEIDRYDLRTNTELWNATYLLLKDVQSLSELSANDNPVYQGVSKVMQAYLISTLTDLWGDVPYSEALQGASTQNFTPRYDTQEQIYTGENGILDLLRDAVVIFEDNEGGIPISGDIMFNGNVDKWIRFANSLRIRYLLRISKRVSIATEMNDILTGGRIMQSNADNALIPYLSTAPNQWFVHNIRLGDYGNVRMTTTIDSVLKAFDDPRITTFFKPTVASENTGNPVYTGIPNGLGPESRNDYDLSEVSLLGSIFRDVPDGVDAIFMLYSELQFALAEAAHLNLIAGTPDAYYHEGIQASFDYYDTPMPTDYLNRTEVLISTHDPYTKIMTQKWLASMLVGYEGWFNFRRTGLPALQPSKDNTNNDLIPVRYRYPDSEQAVNPINYQEAVTRMGGDTYNIQAWWERN